MNIAAGSHAAVHLHSRTVHLNNTSAAEAHALRQHEQSTNPGTALNNHVTIYTVQWALTTEGYINTPDTHLPSSTSCCEEQTNHTNHTNHTNNMPASPNRKAIAAAIRRTALKQNTLGQPQLVVALAHKTQDANATN